MRAKTSQAAPRNRRSARPTALAVIRQMLAIIRRRGWALYSFEAIRNGKSQWWLTEAEGWTIDINGAAELAHREVFGHPQVPAIYRFWTPIEHAMSHAIGRPRMQWEVEPGRTHEEVVAALEAAIAYMEANPPQAERRAPGGHKVGASGINKSEVLQRLSLSSATSEIRFDGALIGSWRRETKREFVGWSPRNIRQCAATIPNFCGLRVEKEANTFAALKDAVAASLTGILNHHPDRKVA